MTFILADGSELTVNKEHELFDILLINLGYFGINYSVKLECIPSYYLSGSLIKANDISPNFLVSTLEKCNSDTFVFFKHGFSLYSDLKKESTPPKKFPLFPKIISYSTAFHHFAARSRIFNHIYFSLIKWFTKKAKPLGVIRWDHLTLGPFCKSSIDLDYFIPEEEAVETLGKIYSFFEENKKLHKVKYYQLRRVGPRKKCLRLSIR